MTRFAVISSFILFLFQALTSSQPEIVLVVAGPAKKAPKGEFTQVGVVMHYLVYTFYHIRMRKMVKAAEGISPDPSSRMHLQHTFVVLPLIQFTFWVWCEEQELKFV